MAEKRVLGADLVEAHLVDQLFENHRIVGEQVHAPLPVVVPDGAGNDLLDLVAVTPADHAVLVHHPLALRERNHVPVLLLVALAIHGIEAEVLGVGYAGPQAGGHGRGAALKRCGNLRVPLRRVLRQVLARRRFVGLARGFVKAEFHHGDVGVTLIEEAVEVGLRQLQFHLVERFKRVAEVNENQVALVAELREERRVDLSVRGPLERAKGGDRFGGYPLAFAVRAGPPRLPVETEKLMQRARSFKRERNGGKFSQHTPLPAVSISFNRNKMSRPLIFF